MTSKWQKSQRQLFKRKKKINGRKLSESEKSKLPTPRTFGESRKDSWVLPPYMEWEVQWISCGKYLIRMLSVMISCTISDVFFVFISVGFSNNANKEASQRLSMSYAPFWKLLTFFISWAWKSEIMLWLFALISALYLFPSYNLKKL